MPVAIAVHNETSRIPTIKKQNYLNNSPFQCWLSEGQSKLPPEIEKDNVEYKWKLTGMSEERRIHLVTQMRWRVGELGYCWYILGVKDDGTLEGIDELELEATLDVIKDLVGRANLFIEIVDRVQISNCKFICQVKIELEASDRLFGMNTNGTEGRVLFLGGSGSGKTTILSVLSDWGNLDDGKGKMRTRLLHHRHELLSGSTSSVTHQPIVFLKNTKIPLALTDDSVLLQLERRKEILGEGKVLQLVDSAGKLRFDRTVFSVLTSAPHKPDLAFIVLEAGRKSGGNFSNEIIPQETVSTFRLLQSLKIPVALLINKIDQSSTEEILEILQVFSEQVDHCKQLEIYDESKNIFEFNVLPVLLVSTVSGDFLTSLAHFLHSIHPSPLKNSSLIHAQESALIIEQVVHVTNIGTIVYGQVAFGSICVGDSMILGPQINTENLIVRVKSIQRLKCPVNQALSSQHVSLALEFEDERVERDKVIRKGMALLSSNKSTSNLKLKPLKRIIAELEQISGNPQQTKFNGTIYVMGQRFSAILHVQTRSLKQRTSSSLKNNHLSHSSSSTTLSELRKLICLVSFPEKGPANVFLFPTASIVFIGIGRKEKFAGSVIDYFA